MASPTFSSPARRMGEEDTAAHHTAAERVKVSITSRGIPFIVGPIILSLLAWHARPSPALPSVSACTHSDSVLM